VGSGTLGLGTFCTGTLGIGTHGTLRTFMALTASQRAKAGAIALAGYPLIASLGRTLTWRVDGAHHYDDVRRAGETPILALWHGRILPATLYWRQRGIVAMTSENFDGEWVARLMGRFGYRAARGSTSHGGSRALVQLRRELSRGHTAAFTVDGPRGPARVAQRGALWLAGATAHPVLPFHIEADKYWSTKSWDRTLIPKPFSTVAIAIGDPFHVADTSETEIERQRRELENRLAALEQRCQTLLAQAS
jgi:lysophospholipid acyltransferase (LPLAT)-like uncharacterized protein